MHVALYVGIPYCSSHCLYCSFPSRLVGKEEQDSLQSFSKALETDLQDLSKLCRQYSLTVDTIYIGGGTPTCLPTAILEDILQSVAVNFSPVHVDTDQVLSSAFDDILEESRSDAEAANMAKNLTESFLQILKPGLVDSLQDCLHVLRRFDDFVE